VRSTIAKRLRCSIDHRKAGDLSSIWRLRFVSTTPITGEARPGRTSRTFQCRERFDRDAKGTLDQRDVLLVAHGQLRVALGQALFELLALADDSVRAATGAHQRTRMIPKPSRKSGADP
jgi:hypothetical protein